jgi:hypothetical protein
MTGNDYNLALCLFFVTYLPLSSSPEVLDIFFSKSPPILPSAKFVRRFSSQDSCLAGESYFIGSALLSF